MEKLKDRATGDGYSKDALSPEEIARLRHMAAILGDTFYDQRGILSLIDDRIEANHAARRAKFADTLRMIGLISSAWTAVAGLVMWAAGVFRGGGGMQ